MQLMRYFSPLPVIAATATVALSLLGATAGQAQSINTLPAWDGTSSVNPWGVPDTATYGQTFRALNTRLDDVTFELISSSGSAPINYKAYVYAWDGTKATGAALFSSSTLTYVPTAVFTPVTVTTGANLTTGSDYVVFFSTAGLQGGASQSLARWGTTPDSAYANGNFVFLNNGNDFSAVTSTSWTSYNIDTAFRANFSSATSSPVPEASTWVSMGMGTAMMGGMLLRTKRRKPASR